MFRFFIALWIQCEDTSMSLLHQDCFIVAKDFKHFCCSFVRHCIQRFRTNTIKKQQQGMYLWTEPNTYFPQYREQMSMKLKKSIPLQELNKVFIKAVRNSIFQSKQL